MKKIAIAALSVSLLFISCSQPAEESVVKEKIKKDSLLGDTISAEAKRKATVGIGF